MSEPSHSTRSKKEFDMLLLDAIDRGLMALGESVMESIYYHLEKTYSIKRDEIPNRLEDFSSGLERMFGTGGKVMEKLIVEELHSRLRSKFEERAGHGFADCVNEAKAWYLRTV